MAVIDLSRRIVSDKNEYNKNKQSCESYIYIESEDDIDIQDTVSLSITIGDAWYDGQRHFDRKITEKGVKIKSKRYAVFQTQQYLGIPYNVFGVVVGKGINIFNGGVISTGKIVPGYKGKLRIGYYNASGKTIILHKGDVIGSCVFFSIESTSENEYMGTDIDDIPALEILSRKQRFFEWIGDNWYSVLASIFSVVAIIVSIISIFV